MDPDILSALFTHLEHNDYIYVGIGQEMSEGKRDLPKLHASLLQSFPELVPLLQSTCYVQMTTDPREREDPEDPYLYLVRLHVCLVFRPGAWKAVTVLRHHITDLFMEREVLWNTFLEIQELEKVRPHKGKKPPTDCTEDNVLFNKYSLTPHERSSIEFYFMDSPSPTTLLLKRVAAASAETPEKKTKTDENPSAIMFGGVQLTSVTHKLVSLILDLKTHAHYRNFPYVVEVWGNGSGMTKEGFTTIDEALSVFQTLRTLFANQWKKSVPSLD